MTLIGKTQSHRGGAETRRKAKNITTKDTKEHKDVFLLSSVSPFLSGRFFLTVPL